MKHQNGHNKNPYKKIKKDYHRQSLKNPFFRTDGRRKSRWFKWIVFSFILILGFLVWFFLAAPYWRPDNFKLEGLNRTASDQLEEIIYQQLEARRCLFFRQDNIFLFDRRAVAEKMKIEFNLAEVIVKRKLPRTLIVRVSERPLVFIFREGSDLFYVSRDAYIIKEPPVNLEETGEYPILDNKGEESLIDSSDKLEIKEDYLNFFLALNAALALEAPDLRIESFIIDQEFNTITLKASAGPAIYFNIQDAVANQIDRLLLVKKEKIKDNFSRTDYIDLRYGDRVFINPDFK